jgi:multiple sugar transport system permease protein
MFGKKNESGEINYNIQPRNIRMRPYYIILPGMIVLIGVLIPFAYAIIISFTNASFRIPSSKWHWNWFANWFHVSKVDGKWVTSGVLGDVQFWHAILITLAYGLSATIVETLLGMGVAFLLKKDTVFSHVLKVVLMFPLMIAPAIAVLIWNLMLSNSVGIVEKFLNLFGIVNFPWAASPHTALMTAVLIDVWVNTPFMLLLILAGIQSLPKSPFEAAQVDGASGWFTFKTLTLPLLKPFILIALVFRSMAAFQEFAIPFSLTKGGPGDSLMNLSLTSYLTAFTYQRVGAAMPYILVLWVVIFYVAKWLVNEQRKAVKEAAGM